MILVCACTSASKKEHITGKAKEGITIRATQSNKEIMTKIIFKIIIHVMKLLQKMFECFTSKPNAQGAF